MTPLTTDRLELAPFDAHHVDALLRLFRDPHVRRFLLDDTLVDRAWVEDEVRDSEARFEAGSLGLFAAHLRDAPDVLVGFVGLRPFYDPPVLQLVCGLAPGHTGRGLATEMARAVTELAWRTPGFTEVRASTDEPNVASVRVLERLGMRYVSTEPGERWPQRHFVVEPPSYLGR